MEEEILKSIKEEMEVKEKEFNQVMGELSTLEQNYTVRKTQLEDSKEQIRGAYTALYRQLEKFSKTTNNSTPTTSTPKSTTTNNVENMKSNTTTNTETTKSTTTKKEPKNKSTQIKPSTTQVVAGLTPEEIAKINKAIPKTGVVDSNGNEVPDYLQEEYNK